MRTQVVNTKPRMLPPQRCSLRKQAGTTQHGKATQGYVVRLNKTTVSQQGSFPSSTAPHCTWCNAYRDLNHQQVDAISRLASTLWRLLLATSKPCLEHRTFRHHPLALMPPPNARTEHIPWDDLGARPESPPKTPGYMGGLHAFPRKKAQSASCTVIILTQNQRCARNDPQPFLWQGELVGLRRGGPDWFCLPFGNRNDSRHGKQIPKGTQTSLPRELNQVQSSPYAKYEKRGSPPSS